jgi:spore maturation protein CgeB
MRILVCGNKATHEWPESCVRALQRLGHETRLVYHRTPQAGQVERYLPAEMRGRAEELFQIEEGRRALMEVIFYHLAAEFRPDLILLAGIYYTFSADALADVQEHLGIPVVLWSGDNPYVPQAPDIFSRGPYYEAVMFANYRFADRAADSFKATAYVPFGCDPERDVPADDAAALAPYACDVSFLGTIKDQRAEFLDGLAQRDFTLKVWGAEFPDDVERRFPHLHAARQAEHVQGDKKVLVYGASKIVLNLHHTGFANMKLYEAAACGAFQISNKRLECESTRHRLSVCDDMATYETEAELHALIDHFLAHPEQRTARAARLRERVLTEHTWDHRLQEILDHLAPALPLANAS